MDTATQLLLDTLKHLTGTTLWLVDEQIDSAAIASVAPRPDLFALGNRSDVTAALCAHGINATLNDFNLTGVSATHVLFRVAKEKAVVHHVINCALELLPSGGTVWLAGDKNDGIKTYSEKAALRAGGVCERQRRGTAQLAQITRGAQLDVALDDQDYAQARQLDFAADFCAWTKPGIFGWQKIDAGSAFLCEHLAQIWPQPPTRVLDLGCGYGYLTLRAAHAWPAAYFVATDNNIAATQICARNMVERNIAGRVECCDCGTALTETFDAILCNPPFHQGFAHERALTEKFLRQTQRLLQRGGRALFVVNQFIALEKVAESLFTRVEIVARNKSFKLVAVER